MFNSVQEVKNYVTEKVNEHLSDKYVSIVYSNRMVRVLGTCKENRYNGAITLTFNNKFLEKNLHNGDIIKNTVLHEIAHALAGGLHHHDYYWQSVCRRIGGDGLRMARGVIANKHLYKCPNCGKVIERRSKFRKAWACAECCKKYNDDRYSDDYKWEYIGIKEVS